MKIPEDHFCPSDQQDWRSWLEENHIQEDFVWMIIYKKSSKKTNISWSEAVDEALCFGWIDSVKKPIDDEKYKQYFSKRKAQSTWSRVNKEKVDRLIEENKMTEAGLQCIEVAKKNGSWTILDSVENLEVPDDLQEAFDQHAGAEAYFHGLSKSDRKIILSWIVMAKRSETRNKRIQEAALMAGKGKKPNQF